METMYRLELLIADDQSGRARREVKDILKRAAKAAEEVLREVDDIYLRNVDVVAVL